jgi:hypothetical protein
MDSLWTPLWTPYGSTYGPPMDSLWAPYGPPYGRGHGLPRHPAGISVNGATSRDGLGRPRQLCVPCGACCARAVLKGVPQGIQKGP